MASRRRIVSALVVTFLFAGAVTVRFFPGEGAALARVLAMPNTYSAALRLAVPLVLAGLGGLVSEKSGVTNIGIEGFLIISAFTSVFVVDLVGRTAVLFLPAMWVGVVAAVIVTMLFALSFGVVCIEFQANQIIAGLAVWLVALGLAPFVAVVFYGGPNSGQSVGTLANWTVPGLSAIPFVGEVLFDASPFVYLMFLAVALVWLLLNRTKYGRWIRASGENPDALDTAGVDVNRVRYGSIVLSGVLSGLGGAGLAIGQVGMFIGTGQTMVNGRGFIAIAAYIFGNYNPIGTFGAAALFGGLDALQLQLQSLPAYDVPDQLVRTLPYVMVIVAFVFVGKTHVPTAAGENYDSDDD